VVVAPFIQNLLLSLIIMTNLIYVPLEYDG
jgi:hypothetical protein